MTVHRLAENGGSPVRTKAFPPWPAFSESEIMATSQVLASGRVNYWTGQEGREFEREFAAYCGVKHAVALANGTAALELALEALGIGVGDEVIVPCRTFIATASAVVMRRARPVVVDIDRESQNITAETIAPAITERTKAIIVVHLNGWPCDMDPILALARERGIWVIEDCAQAHGAKYKGRPVGSLGDVGAFSFCQDKIMTTGGEGGMLVTNDEGLWKKAWAFKDHGKSFDAVYKRKHPAGFRWLHESFGTNWRMTEMQSAIGRLQLGKLEEWVATRRRNAAILMECFRQFPVMRVTEPSEEFFHSYYKYYVFVRPELLRGDWSRDRIMNAISAEGVPCYSGICPEIYLEKAFEPVGWKCEGRLPAAKELGEASLMFLVHPTLSENDMENVCEAVVKVLAVAVS